jgi:glycerol-3-phosphate dehydrogenase
VLATLTDSRGRDRQRVEIKARRVVLAGGPFGSSRILMQSGVRRIRLFKGAERAVGERFSTHATVTFCADFDEALYPSGATPPMATS